MARVMIHPATYDEVGPAIDRVFKLFPIDISGKKILVKPNALRASRPDEAIVTHPAVLRAVVAKVASLCPSEIIVGDNPGVFSYGANEQCFETTGLMTAAGGYYRNIGMEAVNVAFDPALMNPVSVSKAVFDVDIIISLPRFKTHGLTVISGAIKNSYGFLPGAQKAALHKAAGSPARFQEAIVEVFKIRVPDLFIMDAVVGMEGNGPSSPDLRDVGRILAADNAVAMDAVVAAMMGCDPANLRFLQKANADGLGEYDLGRIEIDGKLKKIPDFKLPPLSGEAALKSPVVQDMLSSKISFRPVVDPDRCTGCGTCADHCPMSVLTIIDGLPEVDPALCIACFCCQELCPEKAIALKAQR